MSLVTLTSGSTQATGEVRASRQWTLPASGQAGQASFFVPYTSSLVNLIDLNAGVTVLIHDADGCGAWWGVVVDADWSEGGITVSAQQVWMMLGRRFVSLTGARRAVQAGMLVTEAVRDSGEVLGMSAPDAPFDGDTLIDLYEWTDQDVWSVVSDMMGRSGNELWVDPESREMSWVGPLATSAYAPLLIAGQSLRGWTVRESNGDRVSEVYGTYSSSTATNYYGTFVPFGNYRYSTNYGESSVAGWPAQASVSAESPSTIQAAAHAELGLRAVPSVAIGGSLSRSHIAIRERQFVNVFIPRKGLTYQCRVLSRTVDDASDDIGVELLAMPTNDITTNMKDPGWVSRADGRGTGSLALRLLHIARTNARRR